MNATTTPGISPAPIEVRPLNNAPVDWAEAKRFLALIGRQDQEIVLAVFPASQGPCIHLPGRLDDTHQRNVELTLEGHPGHSLGLVVNPARPQPEDWGSNPGDRNARGRLRTWGASDAHISMCTCICLECDGGQPLDKQKGLPALAGLPEPSITVWSGSKSLHHYWCLEEFEELTPEEFRALQRGLVAAIEVVAPEMKPDKAISNPATVMRLPGGIHPKTGKRCRIHSADGPDYTAEGLKQGIPATARAVDLQDHPQPQTVLAGNWFDRLPRGKQKELAIEMLRYAPLRVAEDEGLYNTCLTILAGLVKHFEPTEAREICQAAGWSSDFWDPVSKIDGLVAAPSKRPASIGSLIHEARRGGWRHPLESDIHAPKSTSNVKAEQQDHAGGKQEGQQEPRTTRRALSPQEKLSDLRGHADGLLADGVSFADRLPLMRNRAESLDVTLRDNELQRFLWDARRAAAGTIEPLGPGDQINLTPSPWLWSGVVMAKCFNLLVALPKVGKTSLLLAMLGAWHRGERSFLGLDLIGPCPPVLIVGTDQPSQDWGRMLRDVGLLGEDYTITAPIVGLFHKGRPLHLDPEGIERIASYAADHRGLLVVLDSIAACTGPLGLDENSAEIVEPVNDLVEAIEPHGATLVAIHHSSKGRAGESATMASRGSTALPAAASQIISLSRVTSAPTGPKDPRIVLKTEGRGGQPQELLIERTEAGWISHGSAEAVALAQHLQKVEQKLTDRQQEALEFVRERWSAGKRTDAVTLAPLMGKGADRERSTRRTLDQLVTKGLLSSAMENHDTGRRKFFWPVGVEPDRTPSRGGLDNPSDQSDLSDPVRESMGPDPLGGKGSDRSDRKVQLQKPTRESVRPPRQRLNGAPVDLKGWWRDGCNTDHPPLQLGGGIAPVGSGFDAMADDDDPAWPPRPSGAVA